MTITKTYLQYYRDGLDMSDWYDQAHSDILVLCRHLQNPHGQRPEFVAGLLAAFSPRTSVKRSVIWTLNYIHEGTFLQDCPRTVRACVDHFIETGRVRGPKVGPFHRALLGDPDATVIDTHMARAVNLSPNLSLASHHKLQQAVRTVARHRTTPARAQAAIWCGYLRSINRTPRYLPLLETHWNI